MVACWLNSASTADDTLPAVTVAVDSDLENNHSVSGVCGA